MIINGEYFNGHDTRKTPASLIVGNHGGYKVIWADGDLSGPLADVRISARLGNIPRHFYFNNGAQFTTADNEGVDSVIKAAGLEQNPSAIHKLEKSPRIALTALVLTVVAVLLFYQIGIPALTKRAVVLIPPDVERTVSQQTISTMDKFIFTESELDEETKEVIRQDFSSLLAEQGYPQSIDLQFRNSEKIGPNAFALPDGTIVVTDQLVDLAEDLEEIIAVLGHELGHIVNKHGMRRIIENSAITVLMFTLTSDANTVIQAASAFPVMLINNKYSRDYEAEADRFGLDFLQRAGISAEYYASMLRKLQQVKKENQDMPDFLSTHPATKERIELVESRVDGQE